jgi:ABC-type transporter Mla subunit MlaD
MTAKQMTPSFMAQQSQFAAALLAETLETFNGSTTIVSPTDGISLIDNWISALHSGDETINPIAHTLSELRMQLQDSSPSGSAIESLIQDLANQAEQASHDLEGAQQQTVQQLAQALRDFGRQLSGNGSVADQARQGDSDKL